MWFWMCVDLWGRSRYKMDWWRWCTGWILGGRWMVGKMLTRLSNFGVPSRNELL